MLLAQSPSIHGRNLRQGWSGVIYRTIGRSGVIYKTMEKTKQKTVDNMGEEKGDGGRGEMMTLLDKMWNSGTEVQFASWRCLSSVASMSSLDQPSWTCWSQGNDQEGRPHTGKRNHQKVGTVEELETTFGHKAKDITPSITCRQRRYLRAHNQRHHTIDHL